MYTIKLKSYINVTRQKLLRVWFNPQILLKEAKNIKNLRVIRKEKNVLLTLWEVEVDKVRLRWRELDTLDLEKGVIDFRMRDGDFKKYTGTWKIMPTKSGRVTLHLNATIDWGIPVLEPYVQPTLERKTRLLFRNFIKSIKKAAEGNGR